MVVDVNGVGYEVDVPMSTFYQLPAVTERVALLTHFVVREDAQQLYGFLTAAERSAFRELIRISGVGARTALSVLSGLSVRNSRRPSRCRNGAGSPIPGIGKKTAERLLLELKGKLGADLGTAGSPAAGDATADVDPCTAGARLQRARSHAAPCASCRPARACRTAYASP